MNLTRAVGAGAFVTVGALLFTAALFLIGERRMLFEDRFTVYAEFSRLGQLEIGAPVRVAGADAGEVTDIIVPRSPAQRFRVRMEVSDELHPLIRTDSVAVAQTEGLVGSIYVNIQTGSQAAPEIPEGGTIESTEPFTMADLLLQMSDTVNTVNVTVKTLSAEMEGVIRDVSATTTDAHMLLLELKPDLEAMARNGAKVAADTEQVMAGVRDGKGTLGKLIQDDTLYAKLDAVASETQVVMANMKEVSNEARRALVDFRSKDGPAQGVLADMRATLGQAREATADLADNMEAMKRNFLLRGFFNRRGYFDLDDISPADYRSGVLENGKRKAMRIWLSSALLYEANPEGHEQLSEAGRARIESAMATYLKYVPSNPIVVEGFATGGTVEERYRTSRVRAGMVREYVIARYGLLPQYTGYIALAEDAQGSPGNGRWDGVAITLFLDRDNLQFGSQPALVVER